MTYIYENDGSKIWRRKVGAKPDSREVYMSNGSPVTYPYGMWADILREGTKNPGLQTIIDQLIMYYQLGKNDGKS